MKEFDGFAAAFFKGKKIYHLGACGILKTNNEIVVLTGGDIISKKGNVTYQHFRNSTLSQHIQKWIDIWQPDLDKCNVRKMELQKQLKYLKQQIKINNECVDNLSNRIKHLKKTKKIAPKSTIKILTDKQRYKKITAYLQTKD